MIKPILIIQNDVNEGAGLLLTLIHQRQLKSRTMLGWDIDYKGLKVDDYSSLVILGGAQGVYEVDKYPYLQDEINLTKSFIKEEKSVIGFCLGAQIMAKSLGGNVLQNKQKEIGWFDIKLNEAALNDDLMMMQPITAKAYHFHGDYFSLPPECVSLAKSEITECQLFRYKNNVYGFQFHAEVDEDLISVMCRTNADYMQVNGYDADEVIKKSKTQIIDYQLRCSSILNKWLDKVE